MVCLNTQYIMAVQYGDTVMVCLNTQYIMAVWRYSYGLSQYPIYYGSMEVQLWSVSIPNIS